MLVSSWQNVELPFISNVKCNDFVSFSFLLACCLSSSLRLIYKCPRSSFIF